MDRILTSSLYLIIFLVIYIDIDKKYIPNLLNIFILILAISINGLKNLDYFLVTAACYTFPLILLYGYISDLVKKDVIGFGDIKLVSSLSGLLYNENSNLFLQIYIFYLIVFASASIYILFLLIYKCFSKKDMKLKNKEIAFAPFICLSFVILYNFRFIQEFIL